MPRFNSWVRKIHWRRDRLPPPVFLGFLGGSDSKESTCNVGDLGLNPGSERSPGDTVGVGVPGTRTWSSPPKPPLSNCPCCA